MGLTYADAHGDLIETLDAQLRVAVCAEAVDPQRDAGVVRRLAERRTGSSATPSARRREAGRLNNARRSRAVDRGLVELTDPERWETADSTRDQQDEYCEWRTTRDTDGRLTSAVFSTEVPEYWDHIAENDRELLVALYREHVDPGVVEADLFEAEGIYERNNKWNNATSDEIAHLRQQSNTLLVVCL